MASEYPAITCSPNVADVELYHTNVDPSSQIFIPYSLALRYENLTSPFEFLNCTYTKDGSTVTTGLVIGERSTLGHLTGNNEWVWDISNLVAHFGIPGHTWTLNPARSRRTGLILHAANGSIVRDGDP